jgi:prepilin-type processing-associated H-X9-DG protein
MAVKCNARGKSAQFTDFPASYHNGAAGFSFADGHGEIKKWLDPRTEEKPLLSHSLLQDKVFPKLEQGRPLFFILIDNMRFDQWKAIAGELSDIYRMVEEELYCSILPTATQFSRNAIFSGLMPVTIAETMPELWIGEEEEESKNNYEEELLRREDRVGSVDVDAAALEDEALVFILVIEAVGGEGGEFEAFGDEGGELVGALHRNEGPDEAEDAPERIGAFPGRDEGTNAT